MKKIKITAANKHVRTSRSFQLQFIKIFFLNLIILVLSGCNGFFDKDNTPPPSPLVKICPETRIQSVWSARTGCGVGKEYLKLVPALSDRTIYTPSSNGAVTAIDKFTGKRYWQTNTGVHISGGAAAGNGLVVVGSRDGCVIALHQCDGSIAWRNHVSSEILAAPAIGDGVVVVKSIDGKVNAFSVANGDLLWNYEESEPLLILRGSSAPKIYSNNVIVGFANGSLSRLTLRDGSQEWHQSIATAEGSFAIQRMIDIDADPIVFNRHIYAATYQGKIAALDFTSGRQFWSHDISSYIGLASDGERVYVSDAKGDVWAFDASSGNVFWRQTQLEYRNLSGPAIICNYIVVGDQEGYLHLLNKQDGHFVARIHVDGSGILATPVVDNNTIYVFTQEGRLAAYTLG